MPRTLALYRRASSKPLHLSEHTSRAGVTFFHGTQLHTPISSVDTGTNPPTRQSRLYLESKKKWPGNNTVSDKYPDFLNDNLSGRIFCKI